MPFLGPALGYLIAAMCSPGWGNLVALEWNDLPMGREFDGKFLKNVESPPHALPPRRRLYINRCIKVTSFALCRYNKILKIFFPLGLMSFQSVFCPLRQRCNVIELSS